MNSLPPASANHLALRKASARGDVVSVQRCLALVGIDVNATDDYGRTALSLAAMKGHASTVAVLLARPDIDTNVLDRCGRTALILAAYQGYSLIVAALLELPSTHINIVDVFGRTALVMAICNGHVAIVQNLLNTPGIQVNISDRDGLTALAHARSGKNPMVIAALKQAFKRDRLMEAYRRHFCFSEAQVWAATMPEILGLRHQPFADRDVMILIMRYVAPLTYQEAKNLLPFLVGAHDIYLLCATRLWVEHNRSNYTAGTHIALPKVITMLRPCNAASESLATTGCVKSQAGLVTAKSHCCIL